MEDKNKRKKRTAVGHSTLLNYFSAKPSTVSVDHNKSTTSTVSAECCESKRSQSPDISVSNYATNCTSQKSQSHSQVVGKLDIGIYVTHSGISELSDELKFGLLNSPWEPDDKYTFQKVTSRNLSFQLSWIKRWPWLTFSHVKQGSFCKYCVVFGKNEVGKGKHQSAGGLVTSAYTNWRKAKEYFSKHESTLYHKESVLMSESFLHVKSGVTESVLLQIDSGRKTQALENRKRLVPIIDTLVLCGRQGLPLRGHKDSGPIICYNQPVLVENDGNFRTLLRLKANSGDQVLQNHFNTCGLNSSYISPKIQNEIIEACAFCIQDAIVKRVNAAKCFTLLADETTDISGTEQLTVCVRYFDLEAKNIREDFLGFVPIFDLSGKAISEVLLDFLSKAGSDGIDLRYLRGQGYDGAACMSGKINGVQANIRKHQFLALYMHCTSHGLNLVLCKCCTLASIRNCLGTVTETCTFFRASAQRTTVLKEHIRNILPEFRKKRLLPLCETRWVERHDALLTFGELLEPISNSLDHIKENGNSDSSIKASQLRCAISASDFIISLYSCIKVFSISLPLAVNLQREDNDIVSALDLIKQVNETVKNMRDNAESQFSDIFKEAQAAAEMLDTDLRIPRRVSKQVHRANYSINDPVAYYRAVIFIPFLDHFLSEMKTRFLNHSDIVRGFRCILPIYIHNIGDRNWSNDVKELLRFYAEDLDSENAVKGELCLWASKWGKCDESMKPKTAIDALNECDEPFYPNLRKLLKILCTLPVTTSTAERSFSTLRRVKSYLRATMNENRLLGLALLNIHRDIPVNAEDIIEHFTKSSRRLDFAL